MFESDRFSNAEDNYSWQRDLLTFLTIACVLFSIFYYGTVVVSEVCGCTPRWLQKILAKKHKMSHFTNNLRKKANGEEEDDDSDIIEMTSMSNLVSLKNPMQNREKWRTQQLEDELKATRSELQKLRDINASLVKDHRSHDRVTSVESALQQIARKQKPAVSKKKINFGQRRTDDTSEESTGRRDSLNPVFMKFDD